MIQHALEFLCSQVNNYLLLKLDPPPSGDAIALHNVSQLNEPSGNGNSATLNAFMTLVNVEEDRVRKKQENYGRGQNGMIYKNPELYLNLFVLCSVNLGSYTESLRRLSLIIQFFQSKNVFTTLNTPGLDPKIETLMVEMQTLGFEQLNHLWGILGGKFLPSVLYKVRAVTIDENAVTGEAGFIREININPKTRFPVS